MAVAPRDASVVDAVIDAAGPPRKVFVHGAGRCGECHEKMYDEWERSAHAQAASSDVYKAAVASAKDPSCDGCHAPLARDVPKDGIASEGVTCDVCHTIKQPVAQPTGAGFSLAIDDMVKFGPRCDLKDHYFHRMGCSPEHKQAEICGACHWWEPKGLPVFTEYKDWRDGPAAQADEPCQGCHMPKDKKAVIATGSPARLGVPHHGLLGLASDLRKRALAVEVGVKDEAGRLAVTVALTNATAGHHVPAGLPGRRIVVTARVRDQAGTEVASDTRALGRVLVDDTGAEVVFWRATRVGSDTRIAQGARWQHSFSFQPSAPGSIEVEVVYRGLSDAIAKQLAITDVETIVLSSVRIPFGAAQEGGRALLPKTVTIKPPPPGKRPRR